jgi:hypothetical protein
MGWDKHHVHIWIIHKDIEIAVCLEEGDVPFCAWTCQCGAWKWRLAPQVKVFEEYTEI